MNKITKALAALPCCLAVFSCDIDSARTEVFACALPDVSSIKSQSDIVPLLVDSRGSRFDFPLECAIRDSKGKTVGVDYVGFNYTLQIKFSGKKEGKLANVSSIQVLEDPDFVPRLFYSTATIYRYYDSSYFIPDLKLDRERKFVYEMYDASSQEGDRLLVALPFVHKDLAVSIGKAVLNSDGERCIDESSAMFVDCWDGGEIIRLEQ